MPPLLFSFCWHVSYSYNCSQTRCSNFLILDTATLFPRLQCILLRNHQYNVDTKYNLRPEIYIVDWLSRQSHAEKKDKEILEFKLSCTLAESKLIFLCAFPLKTYKKLHNNHLQELLTKEVDYLNKVLCRNSYPDGFLKNTNIRSCMDQSSTHETTKEAFLSVPYIQGLSKEFRRIFKDTEVRIIFKGYNTPNSPVNAP